MNGLITEVIEDHIRCASIRPTTPSARTASKS
jgi:hypothetical protein